MLELIDRIVSLPLVLDAAEEPPKKPAPKEVAGYLSKFDADFERAMAKHRRHL